MRRNNSASVRRALALLLRLGEDGVDRAGAALSDLSEDLSINKSTALRLLTALCDTGLVDRDPTTGRYRLGWRTAQLGQAYLERLDLRDAAHDVLASLVAETGETAHLVLADPPEVVYIDKVDSPQAVRMHARIGTRQPMHCTAVGKAVLACADPEVLDSVIAAGLVARTPDTVVSAAALRRDLAGVRRRGYAIDNVENEPGVRCVAAAVRDHDGRAPAAISVSGPAARVTSRRVPELGRIVAEAARTVSARLGAPR